jgi:Domain of unknown function (DUF4263)
MSIRAIFIASHELTRGRERLSNHGIATARASYDNAIQLIKAPVTPDFLFDAIIICDGDLNQNRDLTSDGRPLALLLADEIAALPPSVAMFDGRQWRSIPILVILTGGGYVPIAANIEAICGDNDDEHMFDWGAETLGKQVEAYREAILSEYGDAGLIVHYERGRYVVNPALKLREQIEGRYYYGPADKRPKGFITVHRDRLGRHLAVDEFEWLINREDVSEQELQRFFENHPHFLSMSHTAMPRVRLQRHDGSVLIPDFVLKPIFAQRRDSHWEVLDLKLPSVKLLSGKAISRRKLSSHVMSAVRQLRDYKEHFEDPRHTDDVARRLGHALRRPKLGILIGRLKDTDIEALEREQEYVDVRIVTYDEILDRQVAQIGG